MAGLAQGGHAPVATFALAGIAILVGGIYLDPLNGLLPLLGVLCLMTAVFFANFWRDPDRPIPQESGVLVSPADGHVMFVRRERANGRRPSQTNESKMVLNRMNSQEIGSPNPAAILFLLKQNNASFQWKEKLSISMFGVLPFSCPHSTFT